MVWNYRIVKTQVQDEIRHGIHEVYYGTGSEEIPSGQTTGNTNSVCGACSLAGSADKVAQCKKSLGCE